MKWRDDETIAEWCLRVIETENKMTVADAILDIETMIANNRPWCVNDERYHSARDLLMAKFKQIEDRLEAPK